MAEEQSNATLPTSGVIHVRTHLSADFTVVANALAQRRGSAVTIGVATYILSLPDGAPVSIAALCEHFTEGEILISRALRELEDAGYLERRRVRDERGAIRTRTYFYDVPVQAQPPEPPKPPTPPRPRRRPAADAPAPAPLRDAAPPLDGADPQAVAVLAALRLADRRLVLSRRDVAELAPAVTEWLAAGIEPAQVTAALTTGLPDRLLARPARILAFRLSQLPLPAPAPASARPAVILPWQTCDGGCERAFRAAEPGCCRDCQPAAAEKLRAVC